MESNINTHPNDLNRKEANERRTVLTTPASGKTAVLIDLTSSPGSTRSRSPLDDDINEEDNCSTSDEISPHKRRANVRRRGKIPDRNNEMKESREDFGNDNDCKTAIRISSSSSPSEQSSTEDNNSDTEKVEDGIIGMRIRTPGRKST